MPVYGYVRESTSRQVLGLDAQVLALRRYADLKGLELRQGDLFIEAGVSAFRRNIVDREVGKALCGRLRRGDHLIIHRLDRAFRRTADTVRMIELWRRQGVTLHIVDLMGGSVDCSTPWGEAIVTIVSAIAQMESCLKSERTKDALAQRKSQGQPLNRYAGYGFKWVKDGPKRRRRVVDEEERTVMRAIRRWHDDEGWSLDAIRQHLGYTLRLKTKWGQPWGLMRVQRAIVAERRLQQLEAEGIAPTPNPEEEVA